MATEPDITGGGSRPDPNTPFSSESTGGQAPAMLGVNGLQAAITQFQRAVTQFQAATASFVGGGVPGGFGGNGNAGSGGGSHNNAGTPRFSAVATTGMAAGGIYAATTGNKFPENAMPHNWGGGAGFMGKHTFGGSPMGGGFSGSGFGGGTPNGGGSTFGGGTPGGGGGSFGGAFNVAGVNRNAIAHAAVFGTALFSGVGNMVSAASNFGKNSLPTQMMYSNMIANTMLMNNQSSGTGLNNQILRQAMIAPGTAQANVAAFSTLQNLTGSANLGSQFGRTALGAFGQYNFGAQGYGAAQTAQTVAQIYNPMTAMRMMMSGMGSPLGIGGRGDMSGAQLQNSMMQRMFQGRSSISASNFAVSFGANSVGRADVAQATGLSGNALNQYIQQMSSMNKVENMGNMSASAASKLLQQANAGNKGARAQLDKYGVQTTEQTTVGDYQKNRAKDQADIYNSFKTGLDSTIASLNGFQRALQAILNLPVINQLIGGGAGALGALNGVASGGGDLLKGIGGLGEAAFGAYGLYKTITHPATSLIGGVTGILGHLFGQQGAGQNATTKGAPHGNTGNGGNQPWTTQTMNVTAQNVYINTKNIGTGSSGGGGGGSGGVSGAGGLTGFAVSILKNVFGKDGLFGKIGSDSIGKMLGPHGGGSSGAGNNSAGSAGAKSTTASKISSGISAAARKAEAAAQSQLGVPYVWGGETPGQGFDCSGLTQWAYAQAGVQLPRTSQEQWTALSRKRIALDKVQEGDLIFKAGSDGTATSPGHVAMMISQHSYVEAEETGTTIHDRSYSPGEWVFAARPSGSTAGSSAGGPAGSASSTSSAASSGAAYGGGGATGGGGSPSSTSEASNVSAGLGGGGYGGSMGAGINATTSASAPATTNAQGAKGSGGKASTKGITGGGSIAANKALMQRLAAAYGWGSGAEWDALDWIEMAEAGYNNQIYSGGQVGGLSNRAFGIPQALPWSKMPKAAWPKAAGGQADPKTQELWMLDYIKGRYTDPINAKAFHQANNFYADGTNNAKKGAALVGERGPEMVYLSGGQKVSGANKPAYGPWQSSMSSGNESCGGSTNVTLSFGANSIVIGGNGTGTNPLNPGQAGSGNVQATSNSAKEMVRQIKVILESEDLHAAIAHGKKGS